MTEVAPRSTPAPPARLRAVHPASLRWTLDLGPRAQVVGRTSSDEVELGLEHGSVSRRHFMVRWDDARHRHLGQDLGSHNGSRVDGRDVGDSIIALQDGSIVQLGDVCLVYERGAALASESDGSLESSLPGRAPAMVALRHELARLAASTSPVLLRGELGTGKEHIARALHTRSGRSGSFRSVPCSMLDPRRLERALFGHDDDPGLLRSARGGTVFLEEIGALPLSLQLPLLRVLRDGEPPHEGWDVDPLDLRVVASTRADLSDRVEAGAVRRDLFETLAAKELRVPPLRERRGDVLAWLERLHTAWLDGHPDRPGGPLTLSPEAAETLLLHDWPSNLRDLDRVVDELASDPALARPIAREWLPGWLHTTFSRASNPRDTVPAPPPVSQPPAPSREEFIDAFERLRGDVRALARHFGRDRRQIYRWIDAHGVGERPDQS